MSGKEETPLVCSCDVGYLGTGAWDRAAQSYQTPAPARAAYRPARHQRHGPDAGVRLRFRYLHKPGVAATTWF